MSLKRANYLCGHQSCDNKKCSVRLSRELTRAACHVLERGFRDAKRKERLMAHVTEAGEVIPDLPDLSVLNLPLIEDSDTKISLASEKLDETKENSGKTNETKLEVKRGQQESLQSDEQISESSVNRKSNRLRSVDKSLPRSAYGQGSDYLKFGGIDMHCKKPSDEARTSITSRSDVEKRMAGSSKLTNVFGECNSSYYPKGSTARTDFFKNRNTLKPIKVGNGYRNQVKEPIIYESRRSSNARSNLNNENATNAGGIASDGADDMQVLFRFNSAKLTRPKVKVQDMLREDADNNDSTLNGERTTETAFAQNKFPSVWDASDSDDSDDPALEGTWRLQPSTQENRLAFPKNYSINPKNSSYIDTISENSQKTSNHEETCVSKELKKEMSQTAPKRTSVSFSARMPLPPVQESRASFGRNASEFSTRNKFKLTSPIQPQTVNVAADNSILKPRTADVLNSRTVNSRRASMSFQFAENSSTRVAKSKTPSATSRPSTSGLPNGRTASKASTASKFSADPTVKLSFTPSISPSTTSGSTTRSLKSRIPVATSKLAAMLATSALKSQTPSSSSRTTPDSNTKLIKSRQASTVSTRSKSSAASATKVLQSRPSSAASNSSSDRKAMHGRTESKASTKSKTTAESKTMLTKSQQSSTASTKSNSSAVPTTKVVKNRPQSATSNSSSDRKAMNGRTESKASTKSKTAAESNTRLIKNQQASTASTKPNSSAVPTTKVVKNRPQSATSNSSSDRKAINGRTDSRASTMSKHGCDSTDKLAQNRAKSAANKSRISLPAPTGPRLMGPSPMANVAPKVDCRRPMTAVIAKLPPNVKLVEDKNRPQTSGSEERRSRLTSKPTLGKPSSELKRGPLTLRLGSKTKCIEGERVKVVHPPRQLSTASISQSSLEKTSSQTIKVKPSLPRSPLTSTSCGGWSVGTISSNLSNDSNESSFKDCMSSHFFEQSGQAIQPACPLPENPVLTKQADVSDTSSNLRKPGNSCISHIRDDLVKMLNEEKLSPAEKAAVLKMNREMIKAGKMKPTREGRPTTATQGSKHKLTKENIDWDAEIEEMYRPPQPSNVSVKKRISLFDKLQDSRVITRNVVQNDQPTDEDYATLLELDNAISCVGSQKMQNSLTESMMDFSRDDGPKLSSEVDQAKESATIESKNVPLG